MDVSKSEKGQALFEFLIFTPLIVVLYVISSNYFSAINGSINQQKVTRGYYFSLLKGNSFFPAAQDLNAYRSKQVVRAGMLSVGWRKNLFVGGEDTPQATCYKANNSLINTSNEDCLEKRAPEDSSKFVKVRTIFGMCTTTYDLSDVAIGGNLSASRSDLSASSASCILAQ